jgi:predicted acyl esterase
MKNLILCFVIFFILSSSISINAERINEINKAKILDNSLDDADIEDPPIPSPLYVKETYMVPMRDGVRLATDVYLPSGDISPHGCILIRTPYNKNKQNMGSWAEAGWPTVVQDMRGRYGSEGIDTVFRNAHTDGPDTLEWISEQDWCNGKIATYGGSALGITQYYMAGANPPFLACQ